MINIVTVVGKIMFEPTLNQDETVVTFHVGVNRNYKDPDKQYVESDIIVCKAFKEKAIALMTFYKKDDIIVVTGRLAYADPYTNKDNEFVKGELRLLVDWFDGPFVYSYH